MIESSFEMRLFDARERESRLRRSAEFDPHRDKAGALQRV